MAIPRVPSGIKKNSWPQLTRPHSWPSQSPYGPNDAVIRSNVSIGRKVKTCPVNSEGKTIFTPEWYHGEIR